MTFFPSEHRSYSGSKKRHAESIDSMIKALVLRVFRASDFDHSPITKIVQV